MDRAPERTADNFLTHRGLIAVATVAAMAEAGILVTFAPAARSLAPQVTALPPLAIFHDLRWLYASHRSLLGFTLLLAGLVLARSAVNALLVRLAWPVGVTAPQPWNALRASLSLTVVACVLMSPVVSLTFGVAILPFSWPFLGALPALLLIALPLSHGGVVSDWWRRLPPGVAVGWLFTDFLVLSLASAVTGWLPALGAVALAGLTGLVNARAWYGMTAAVVRGEPGTATHGRFARAARRRPAGAAHDGTDGATSAWAATAPGQTGTGTGGTGTGGTGTGVRSRRARGLRRLPAAPVAVTIAIAVLIGATRVAFLIGVAPPQEGRAQAAVPLAVGRGQSDQPVFRAAHGARPARHRPVLEVAGFGSSCCGIPYLAGVMPDTIVQQFSYRGLSPTGYPLPYGPAASDLPLPLLGDRIAAQVRRLHAETGQRVNVVAESEGTLGVDAMLAEHPDVPIGSVVLLSPIIAPGRVSYQAGDGPGMVPGDELQAVVWFVGGLSPFGTSGAQTLINSVNDMGARFAAAAARHPPSRSLTVVPLADALTLPACRLPANVLVVPAFHGELLSDVPTLRIVRDFLLHRPVPVPPDMRAAAELFAAAGTAWRMPQVTAPSPPCQR